MKLVGMIVIAVVAALTLWALAGAITWMVFDWFDGRAWRRIKARRAQPVHVAHHSHAWSAPHIAQIRHRGDRP